MKTKTKLSLLAVVAAALSLEITTVVGQPMDSVESSKNRAVAASPRAIEVSPWLARNHSEPIRCTEVVTKSHDTVSEVNKNRALTASPRMKEVFAELARPAVSQSESTVVKRSGIDPLNEVTLNRALAVSPRAFEIFPSLARGGPAKRVQKTFAIVPLK